MYEYVCMNMSVCNNSILSFNTYYARLYSIFERATKRAKANNLCITLDIAMILAFVFCTGVLVKCNVKLGIYIYIVV